MFFNGVFNGVFLLSCGKAVGMKDCESVLLETKNCESLLLCCDSNLEAVGMIMFVFHCFSSFITYIYITLYNLKRLHSYLVFDFVDHFNNFHSACETTTIPC